MSARLDTDTLVFKDYQGKVCDVDVVDIIDLVFIPLSNKIKTYIFIQTLKHDDVKGKDVSDVEQIRVSNQVFSDIVSLLRENIENEKIC